MTDQTTIVNPHPHYTARRKNEGRALVQHTLGTLFVLGALILIVNV